MEKKAYYLFDRSTKLGISQFIIIFFLIILVNITDFNNQDKFQILILGSSFFIVFVLLSYDQTKIFGFKFRVFGLLSTSFGIFLVYSPILLFYYGINDISVWINLILIGGTIVIISVISDYYLIGIPEIVRALNYLKNFVKRIPVIIIDMMKTVFYNFYLSIPILLFTLFIINGINFNFLLIFALGLVIFTTGVIKVYYKNKQNFGTIISNSSNQAVMTISNLKWKIDANISSYNCLNCGESIKLTDEKCVNCSKQVNSCLICKLPFKKDVNKSTCDHCKYEFHSNHWKLWIGMRGSCPNCKTNYSVS